MHFHLSHTLSELNMESVENVGLIMGERVLERTVMQASMRVLVMVPMGRVDGAAGVR